MLLISAAAAMAENRVIGRGGQLPWHLPEDLRHFRRHTLGKPVLMGRRTFESMGRALPGRRNLVLSRSSGFRACGCEVIGSLEAAMDLVSDQPEVVIIGGGELYRAALPDLRRIYLTVVHHWVQGDVRFPDLQPGEWRETGRSLQLADARHAHPFSFVELERCD